MYIVGIDEVGRGCWAGPLVAGAVALPDGFKLPAGAAWKLDDSKRLSKRQRELADKELRSMGLAFGIGWVPAGELDEVGIAKATALAMRRAYDALPKGIEGAVSRLVIDGAVNYLPDIPRAQAVVKADGSVPAVSAASILAKVARDNWMAQAARRFPGYDFEKHVGYGTRQHANALRRLGVCELHRRSFKPVAALLA